MAPVSLVRSGGSDDSGGSGSRRGLEVIGQIWRGTHLINQQNWNIAANLLVKLHLEPWPYFPIATL